MTDKRLFGVLQQFKNLIIFANENGSGKNGAFIDADFIQMRKCVVTILKDNPQLRNFFRECVNDANAGGIITSLPADFSKLKL